MVIVPAMDRFDSNTVALVTGATSGIGEATAIALANAGARVTLAGRRTDRLEAVRAAIAADHGEDRVLAVTCDVTKRAEVAELVDRTLAAWQRIDIVVNNAGVMPLAPMNKCRMDDWDRMVDINIKGVLNVIGHTLPTLIEQGTGDIINVSSVAGRRLFSGATVYCGTKHAVHAITEGLRGELSEQAKSDGNTIRVSVLAPGVVTTELAGSITDEETRTISQQYYDTFPDPLTSEDMARAICWIAQQPAHVGINELVVRPTRQVK